MKILEVIPQLHIGGAEHFVVDLCNEFVSKGHDVTLVVTNSLEKYGHFEKFLSPKVNLICMNKREGPDPVLFFRLARLVRKLKPDIIHTHLGAVLYNVISPYYYPKAQYFHTIHNTAEKEAIVGGKISSVARKWMFKKNRVCPVTISEESDKSFNDYYGDICKSVMIPNGVSDVKVDIEQARELKGVDGLKLVNVARIMKQKNQIELVKAVEELNTKGYKVRLYLVGYDNTEEAEEIRNLNAKSCIILGPRSNPRDYMAAADAFVLSSIYEGMPLTLIECFSVGTIPICTPVGGCLNMIEDGVNGIIAQGCEAPDLLHAIMRLIEMDKEKRDSIENASLDSYSNYSMSECANKYLELFNQE